MRKENGIHFSYLSRLSFLPFRCAGPAVHLPVIQIFNISGHDLSGNQGVFRKVEGNAKPGETCQNIFQLFPSPISLVLMALNADGADGYTGLQQFFNQDLVRCAGIEIVDQQHSVRIAFLRRCEYLLHQPDTALFPADTRNGIIVFIEYRHDDHFIDHVPEINDSLICRHFPVDALQLAMHDLLIGILHEPVRTDGMPAQRMAFQLYAPFMQPFGSGHGFGIGCLPFHRLITAPVKRQCAVIEQPQPFAQTLLQDSLFCLIPPGSHQFHRIKSSAAEKKLVRNLIDPDRLIPGRCAVRFLELQPGFSFPVFQLIHSIFLL